MRRLLSAVFVVGSTLVAPLAHADEPSNPAFLGVSMADIGRRPNGVLGPCSIERVTPDTGAAAAGIRAGDIVVDIDGTEIVGCDDLVKSIQNRVAGQVVKIKVQRSGTQLTLDATLPSRADVLRKRFVGKPVPLTTLTRVDDQSVADLASRGKTTIVGWFDQENCVGCASAFAKLADWAKDKGKGGAISIVGVTGANRKSVPETIAGLKDVQRRYDVPLMVADTETFTELSINDIKRIHFMVIDCRGIISYVAPLKPDADDRPAVLDELFAATEMAVRRMK